MEKKLFVGGLSYETKEEDIKEFFSQVGTVESVTIVVDRTSGRSKGFGFVEMSSEEEAQNAIKTLNGKEVNGRSVTVNEARPLDSRPSRNGGFGYDDKKRPRRNQRNRY
jgi:cold-inducible RNA-binding protein